jgi:hypothetical protein
MQICIYTYMDVCKYTCINSGQNEISSHVFTHLCIFKHDYVHTYMNNTYLIDELIYLVWPVMYEQIKQGLLVWY